MTKKCFLIFFVLTCMISQKAYSCTTFSLETHDQKIVGTNFDFVEGNGFIFINKRGISKTALSDPETSTKPLKWTSKYGSATFNLWGLEFSYTGMNEKGLVISSLGLRQTKYPPAVSEPSIFSAQLAQYLLDNFKTVKKVKHNISGISIIEPLGNLGKLHYLISDKSGDCAIIEFMDGKAVCYTQHSLPLKVLTNTEYKKSLSCLKTGEIPVPDHIASIDRFVRTSKFIQNIKPDKISSIIDFGFEILELTHMGKVTEVEGEKIRSYLATEWSIIFDPIRLKIYYKTFEHEYIRYFSLSSFDFSCKTPVKALDIQQNLSGNISGQFFDYKTAVNTNFLNQTRSIIPKLYKDQEETLNRLIHYPGTTACIQ